MNYDPIKKHDFTFYLTGISNFHLAIEKLNWNIIDKTISTKIRMFTDSEDLHSCLISKNQGNFQSKLCLLDSGGNIIKTFIFDGVSMKNQTIEMDCSYSTTTAANPVSEIMTMDILFKYKTYKEI